MDNLAISLGHNSSAILIRDGVVVAGYEEERFTGLKADSSFPLQSISELIARYRPAKNANIYVGHWFIDATLPQSNKYWQPNIIKALFPQSEVFSLSADFTHHDSHLESAMVFGGDIAPEYHAIVADGFGSFGECISIYHVQGKKYTLLNRVYGFEKSMGMLYQYATAFMGMKMHNHEYKMLAYEVHIGKVLEAHQVTYLNEMCGVVAEQYLKAMYKLSITSDYDPVTKIEALPAVQAKINEQLNTVMSWFKPQDEFQVRVITSYFVQRVVEIVITNFVGLYSPKNLMVVGGLFYNVKLNHLLANKVPGKFTAMPLAGDQGAALGVYQAYHGDLVWPGNLTWGDRSLYVDSHDLPKGVVVVDTEEQAEAVVTRQIEKKGFCNLVRGNMEYGPRALCNTSTLAIPQMEVTKAINRMNARTMEMPFAPVMTSEQAENVFDNCDKIHKSLEYMIVTRTYQAGEGEKFPGAAHYYPAEDVFTGRPQITAEPFMVSLLDKFGPLVNTSFNFHGVPIVRSIPQILDTHVQEWNTAPDLEPTTVILRNPA
jgi:predicted NodU family carbamoyl transferase